MANAVGNFIVRAQDAASRVLRAAIGNIRDGLNTVAAVATRATQGLSRLAVVLGPILNVVQLLLHTLHAILAAFASIVSIAADALDIIRSLFGIVAALLRFIWNLAKVLFAVVTTVVKAIGSVVSTASTAVAKVVGDSQSGLGRIVKYALGALAILTAAFVAAAIGAEQAWLPVSRTIGRIAIAGAGGAIAGLREFAKEVRRATLTASADVLTLAEQAVRLRIPEGQLKAVSAAAIGLSAALGISAADAMTKLAAAMRGDTSGFNDLIPALKGVNSETARLAIITRIAQQGMELAQKEVSTFAGLWQSFKNVLAENAANLGEKIAPGIKLIVDALRPLLGLLESSGAAFAAIFNTVAAGLAPLLTVLVGWFAHAMAGFIAFGQTVIETWRLTWTLVATTLVYYALVIQETLRHFFTEILPAYFNWFKEFAQPWLQSLGEGLKVGFINLFLNLADVAGMGMAAIWAKITGDDAGAKILFKSMGSMFKRSLIEGFAMPEGGMPKLPEIAGREVSQLERDLKAQMGDLGSLLASAFGINFDKQLAGFNAILNGQAMKDVKNEIGKIGRLPGEGKGTPGSGGTLLESRFLTRAPGSNPIEKLTQQQAEANRLHQQHLDAVRAAAASSKELERRMIDIELRIAEAMTVA